jgi:hypothetical protein
MTDPDECAHRIAHDLHQAFLSGVLAGALGVGIPTFLLTWAVMM